jgi:hypothetical protein
LGLHGSGGGVVISGTPEQGSLTIVRVKTRGSAHIPVDTVTHMQVVAIGIECVRVARTKGARVQARLTVGGRQCGVLTQRGTLLRLYQATGKRKNGQKTGQDSIHFFQAANDYVKRSCKKPKGNACSPINEQNQVISAYFCLRCWN